MARSTDVIDRVEKNLDALSQLIGKENVEEVKKRIGNLIVNRVESDIRAYDYYLFYPEDYRGCIDEAFEKVGKKITKMYADAMLESAQNATQRFKDISVTALDETPGLKLRSCHKCVYHEYNRCKFYEMHYWKAFDSLCAKEGFINFKETSELKDQRENKIVNVDMED